VGPAGLFLQRFAEVPQLQRAPAAEIRIAIARAQHKQVKHAFVSSAWASTLVHSVFSCFRWVLAKSACLELSNHLSPLLRRDLPHLYSV